MSPSDTIIILPAYNEANHILQTLADLSSVSTQAEYDLLVINDGSTDQTADLARQAGCPCLSLPVHLGYGTALQTGYKYAVRNGYRYAIQMDTDGQHDVRFLPEIHRQLRLKTADVVVGSRFLPHDETSPTPRRPIYAGTLLRRLGIRLFRIILRLWGLSVTDPTSGFVGLQRSACEFLATDIFPFDYPDADVLLLLHRNGFAIREIPVYMYTNPERGSIHRGCAPFWYMIKELLAVLFAGVRSREIV
ncbi:MAG TPA: glycosyltransferase family 2 protein [bacterium]|nr:glycosyltransferase family 2 protein [bacterium]HPO09011.1 glycosyltransferase family 2 protein [bacterium]HQO34179.1 glycosyltransferase family 2 protein [bacterium]HQP98759.1 glycosyltransferase family 2 protein [bacterium]